MAPILVNTQLLRYFSDALGNNTIRLQTLAHHAGCYFLKRGICQFSCFSNRAHLPIAGDNPRIGRDARYSQPLVEKIRQTYRG